MYISVVGDVDAGKTTLVNYYSFERIQKYGRTEELGFVKGSIGSTELIFLDCPGHKDLAFYKDLALYIADAILYIVNANNVNLDLLEELKSLNKPILVLLNRFKKPVSLKELCHREETKNHLNYQLLKALDHQVLSFLDLNESPNLCSFPIDLKTEWGVKEFEKFFTLVWSSRVPLSKKALLYMVDFSKKKYKTIGEVTKDSKLWFGDQPILLKDLMKYNPSEKVYILKDITYQALLYDLNLKKESRVELVENKTLSKDLKQLIELSKRYVDQYFIYSKDPSKIKILEQVMNLGQLNWVNKSDLELPQFVRLNFPPKSLKILWTQEKINSKDSSFLCEDSYYLILNAWNSYLENLRKKDLDSKIQELKEKVYIAELLPELVFKNQKNCLICGVKVLYGTLKEGALGILGSEKIPYEIKSLQSNKKRLTHVQAQQSVSVQFELEKPWDFGSKQRFRSYFKIL